MHKTTPVLHLSSRSVYGGFFLVDCIPFLLICRCPIVVYIGFSVCLFINPSVGPVRVLSKPRLIVFVRLVVVGLKSAACKYCASSGLVVWDRILFTTVFGCCVSRGTSHIPVFCCSRLYLLFVVGFYSPSFIIGIVWWCIHNHIRNPMILVGLFSFLG